MRISEDESFLKGDRSVAPYFIQGGGESPLQVEEKTIVEKRGEPDRFYPVTPTLRLKHG